MSGGGAARLVGGRRVADVVTEQWVAVTGTSHPDPDADFFATGADSLAAVRFIHQIRKTTGVKLSLGDFLDDGTLRGLIASVVEQLDVEVGA